MGDKKSPKTAAERSKEYRMRKKAEQDKVVISKHVPKSSAERSRDYRQRKKVETDTVDKANEPVAEKRLEGAGQFLQMQIAEKQTVESVKTVEPPAVEVTNAGEGSIKNMVERKSSPSKNETLLGSTSGESKESHLSLKSVEKAPEQESRSSDIETANAATGITGKRKIEETSSESDSRPKPAPKKTPAERAREYRQRKKAEMMAQQLNSQYDEYKDDIISNFFSLWSDIVT